MVLGILNPALSLHFIFCDGYSFCVCPHFVHHLGDGVKALEEYCWDQRRRTGLILLTYFLFMPLYCVNNTILLNFFQLSFTEVFLMLAKLLCTFQYRNVR